MKKIMFSDKNGLTKAVLEGRKTQTRRIVSESLIDDYENWLDDVMCIAVPAGTTFERIEDFLIKRSKLRVGDIVAIAQSYDSFYNDECNPTLFPNGAGWTNKMYVKPAFMPHQIRITNVRVERLQDISDEDCIKEGIQKMLTGCEYYQYSFYDNDKGLWNNYKTPREAFAHLINKVSRKDVWSDNPYVFVYDFELVK